MLASREPRREFFTVIFDRITKLPASGPPGAVPDSKTSLGLFTDRELTSDPTRYPSFLVFAKISISTFLFTVCQNHRLGELVVVYFGDCADMKQQT